MNQLIRPFVFIAALFSTNFAFADSPLTNTYKFYRYYLGVQDKNGNYVVREAAVTGTLTTAVKEFLAEEKPNYGEKAAVVAALQALRAESQWGESSWNVRLFRNYLLETLPKNENGNVEPGAAQLFSLGLLQAYEGLRSQAIMEGAWSNMERARQAGAEGSYTVNLFYRIVQWHYIDLGPRRGWNLKILTRQMQHLNEMYPVDHRDMRPRAVREIENYILN